MTDPLVGKLFADRFEIEARIGEGGFTAIYRALQAPIDRTVAVKILAAHVATDPSWVQRFHASARALGRVSHPNIVQIYDHGATHDGFHYIAMEFVRGESLRAELDRCGALAPVVALSRLVPVCRGLDSLHARGVVLRDLKPENIFRCEVEGAGDIVKLLSSTILKADDEAAPDTKPGVVLGTPFYMSPEQVRGKPLGPASDIYSAGVVLYEAVSGRRPFMSDNPTEVALQHIRAVPPPLPDEVPGIVQVIIAQAMAKDPAARQRSAEELSGQCEQALSALAAF